MPLKNPNQKSQGGTFSTVGTEKLSKKVFGVRLPESVAAVIEGLDSTKRVEWLRRVITDAARAELMGEGDRQK